MNKTLELVDTTADQCDFVATCHYIQAEGNKSRRTQLGVPALILNVLIGSVLVADLGKVIPDPVKWITAVVALIVSLLVALQTFFKFDEEERKHRQLGNDFNRVSRALAKIKASWLDTMITQNQFVAEFAKIMQEYETVCSENEKCPPSRTIAAKLKKSWTERGPGVRSCTATFPASGPG
jgi:hypothetical protein